MLLISLLCSETHDANDYVSKQGGDRPGRLGDRGFDPEEARQEAGEVAEARREGLRTVRPDRGDLLLREGDGVRARADRAAGGALRADAGEHGPDGRLVGQEEADRECQTRQHFWRIFILKEGFSVGYTLYEYHSLAKYVSTTILLSQS